MIQKDVQKKLLKINQDFYDQYSPSFSATRGRIQPGVRRFVGQISLDTSILDVGCGNGNLAQALAASGFAGHYLGLDMSEGLLAKAAEGLDGSENGDYHFQQVDLADPVWVQKIPPGPYDWLVCFAVLHHLPGENLRKQTVSAFARLVAPENRVIVSVWQWHNSPRLKKRVLPWAAAGLNAEDLDPGDVLLDWRASDTVGLRYVHTFTEETLAALAQHAGFRVLDSFYSDGKPGNLALYQVWQLAA